MDFDQDGDLDLIVGSHGGKLHLFLNQGTTEQANFISETQYFGNIWLGKNASPSTADLDNDGFLDLLVGTFWGKLVQPRNDSSQFLVMRRDYRNIDVNIGSAPTFADLDNGGQLDLVVGSDEGTIFFFRNETPDLQGKWMPLPKYSKGLTFPRGTCPQVVDLDKDGDPDLITGTEDGPVLLYRNDAVVRDTDEAPLDNVFAE